VSRLTRPASPQQKAGPPAVGRSERDMFRQLRPVAGLSESWLGRSLLSAPRTDPYVPDSSIRLPPRVREGKALLGPGVKDFRAREPVVAQLV
jgi:hypothetical protein